MKAELTPQHPGKILKKYVLSQLAISVTEAATQLGVSRVALSRILNGKADISTAMAMRLEKWLEEFTAEYWLHKQVEYNLWQKRKQIKLDIKSIYQFYEMNKIMDKLIEDDELSNLDCRYPIYDNAERLLISIVAKKLKEARNINGYDIDYASKLLGLPPKELKFYEKGLNIGYLQLQLIKRVAEVYEVSIDWIFGLVDDDWELTPQVRAKRENLAIREKLTLECFRSMKEEYIYARNEVRATLKSVITMNDFYIKIYEAFNKFQKTNPEFKLKENGLKLLKIIKQAVGEGRKSNNLLVRHKLLELNKLVSPDDTI